MCSPICWCDKVVGFDPSFCGGEWHCGGACVESRPSLEPGQCYDESTHLPRDIKGPATGDLIISEVLADPVDSAQWFEVYVNKTVDLNGLQVNNNPDNVDGVYAFEDCVVAHDGDYLVFASVTPLGAQDPPYDFSFSPGFLHPLAGGIWLKIADAAEPIDFVEYRTTTPGVARQLSSDKLTADNNVEGNWCDATQNYDTKNKGTPGSVNRVCP